jgi:hypothetical protein
MDYINIMKYQLHLAYAPTKNFSDTDWSIHELLVEQFKGASLDLSDIFIILVTVLHTY